MYNEGGVNALVSLVHDGILSLDIAEKRAARYGVSKENFKKLLDSYVPGNDDLMQG